VVLTWKKYSLYRRTYTVAQKIHILTRTYKQYSWNSFRWYEVWKSYICVAFGL